MSRWAGMLALGASVLSMCCASGVELNDPELAPLADAVWVLHDDEPCGMAFDPVPELLQDTVSAAARWSVATGCDVRVESGGIPIRAEGYLQDETGDAACGLATWDDARTGVQTISIAMVDIRCLPPYTVLHEMGHALADIQAHSLSGVMAAAASKGKSTRINAASLELVCRGMHCAHFEPEVP